MIRFLLIIPLTFIFVLVLAQQDPQFSQYMFNNMSINPGYAGNKDVVSLTALQRIQWVGFPGAPTTSLFTASVPVKLFNIPSGLGVSAMDDIIGFQSTPSLNASYAYIANLRNGDAKLGIGLSLGFLSSTFDSKGGYNWSEGAAETGVPGQTSESAITYDIGLGLYYHTDNLYLGASSTHLTQSTYHFSSGATYSLTRNYYLTTGYNLALADPAFEIQPSAILRVGGAASSIDLSSLVLWNKRIWAGVSYRLNAAIVCIFGLEMSNGIRFGYSYDISVNSLSASTHEIMLSYNFSLVKEKILHKYRSVRFL